MNEPTKILYGDEPGIAKQGVYRNIQWYIIRGQLCPLAYIVIPKEHLIIKNQEFSYDDYPEFNHCNGGLTFCDTEIDSMGIKPKNSIIFGWDYGHCTDYTKYTGYMGFGIDELHVWSVSEIEKEIERSIDDYYTYYCK